MATRFLFLVASRALGVLGVLFLVAHVFADLSDSNTTIPFIPIAIVLFVLGVIFAVIEINLAKREPAPYNNPDDPDRFG